MVDLFLVVSDGGIEVVLTVIAFGITTLQPPPPSSISAEHYQGKFKH